LRGELCCERVDKRETGIAREAIPVFVWEGYMLVTVVRSDWASLGSMTVVLLTGAFSSVPTVVTVAGTCST
jgi:hypothetical protein